MGNINFLEKELNFISRQSRYEDYINKLISKATTTKTLTIDELEEIELSDLCESTEFIGQDEFDVECQDYKVKLATGEEIIVTIEEKNMDIDKLIEKAVTTGELSVHESDEIELSDLFKELIYLGNEEEDDCDCNDWRIILEDGRVLNFKIV